nr:ABC transporter ATP-binding protein [Kineosporia babensis]
MLTLTDVSKHFSIPSPRALRPTERKVLRAVDGVSLSIAPGETFALVGESGSGKSTLGRIAVRLSEPTSGTVTFSGQDVTHYSGRQLRRLRPRMQVIFQDPLGALNPRMTAGKIVAEPLQAIGGLRGSALDDRVDELFRAVGLDPAQRLARPRTLSGGQRQRVGIARAIALNPDLILADEAVSALDVSVQAQIANLLDELRENLGIGYLFIAHGLPIVRQLAQRIGVMYLGRLVECGPADEVLRNPRHPYTRALIGASPVARRRARRERVVLAGDPPNPLSPPSGCRFRTRCPQAMDLCASQPPPTVEITPGYTAECHLLQ